MSPTPTVTRMSGIGNSVHGI
jgi:hypothetical protein